MTEIGNKDDQEFLAAALALGMLDASERAAALQLQLQDRDFARRVSDWQSKADQWLEQGEAHDPGPDMLGRIESALDDEIAALNAQPHIQNLPTAGTGWRTWALSASAATVLLAVGMGFMLVQDYSRQQLTEAQNLESPVQPANIAQIDDDEGAPLLSALYDADTGMLALRVADLANQEFGPELWIISQGGSPRSLGMLAGTSLTVSLSPELRELLVDGATMAITLEPRDGQPHDAPTGAILGTAQLQSLPSSPAI